MCKLALRFIVLVSILGSVAQTPAAAVAEASTTSTASGSQDQDMLANVSFFVIVLVTLSAADLRYRLVPNRIVIPAAVIVLVAHTVIDPSVEWLLGGLGASAFLLVAALAHPKGLGMGDVKLALLLGAMLGRGVALALMIGFLAALVPSLILFVRHGSRARKMAIPLVPFLALGAVVTLFAGDAVLDWYLGLTG